MMQTLFPGNLLSSEESKISEAGELENKFEILMTSACDVPRMWLEASTLSLTMHI